MVCKRPNAQTFKSDGYSPCTLDPFGSAILQSRDQLWQALKAKQPQIAQITQMRKRAFPIGVICRHLQLLGFSSGPKQKRPSPAAGRGWTNETRRTGIEPAT